MVDANGYPSNEIGQLPGVAAYGSAFSYAAWTPNTTVTLCNVPWNNDYRDIVHFASKAALNTYLDGGSRSGPRVSIDKMTYCRFGEPIRLNVPFAEVMNYNYLRVANGAQPVTGSGDGYSIGDAAQTLYYFITNVVYRAPNTTEVYVQLDVWQTFSQTITFGNCYIERGHIGIANENAFDNNGRDYLTIPEGLDVGNEYVVSKTYDNILVDNHDPSANQAHLLVASTTRLFPPYGTVAAPILTMAQGSSYGGVPNGCDLYLFDPITDFQDFMEFMADKPWVTQGIISVTAVPPLGVVTSEILAWETGSATFARLISGKINADAVNSTVGSPDGAIISDRRWLSDPAHPWRDSILSGRYAGLKKFLTYPYTAVELTTYSATPIVLKPECMYGDDIVVLQKTYPIIPNPRLVYIPWKYNAANGSTNVYDDVHATVNDGGEMFDFMTGIFNLPSFSVVNSGYLSYMASNAHGIAFQHTSADWSQTRALKGNDVMAGNTRRDINNSLANAGVGVDATSASASLARSLAGQRALLSGANAIGQLTNGPSGAVGAVKGVINTGADLAIQQNQIDGQANISVGAQQATMRNNQNTGVQNLDSNYQYAAMAAQGDYQNAIAGINARVQDARLIQPTTSGQLGGDAFNLALFKWGVFAKVKTLQPAVMAAIGEYWLRYGYAVNRFGQLPSDFQVMSKFTYWKLRETYVQSGPMPETFRQTIRGIFEKGVTVWANADDIGMIDIADNTPKTGVTL